RRLTLEQVTSERVDAGKDGDRGAAHVVGTPAHEQDERLDGDAHESSGAEVGAHAPGVAPRPQRRRISERLPDGRTEFAVPVVLVADELAVLVARFDDEDALATDDDKADALAPITRRVAGEHDVIGGELR